MSHPAPATSTAILSGLSEVADRYDVILSDVWGVLHDGQRAFPGPAEALTRFRQGGGTVVLITNAPRPNAPIRAQLDTLGVPRSAYDDIVTSGDSTVALIAARGEGPFYHIGPERDRALMDEVYAKTGSRPALGELRDAAHVICSGLFDDRTETPDHYEATYAAMRERGVEMICANPDVVVHVGDQLIFCAGALAERYEALGGTVLYAGKPHAPIYDLALSLAAKVRQGRGQGETVDAARVLAIGDGMRTDVAGAVRHRLDCLFITNGIHRDDTGPGDGTLDAAALARFLDAAAHRPRYALPDLAW
ncbi:MAG: TIGR01459 family HAD-type hydrolase [Janthinobacterium lividum]